MQTVFRFSARLGLAIALTVVGSTGVANAQKATSVTSWHAEMICDSPGDCSTPHTVAVPSGFDNADVFLAHYTLRTLSGAQEVTRVKAEVAKVSYDKINGQFTFNATGSLEGSSPAQFEFHVGVVIVLYYNGYAILKTPSFASQVADGDTTSPPVNRAVINSPFGTISPATFTGFMIRGFEIMVDSPIEVEEQVIDVSNPQVLGTTQAYVDWTCGLLSSTPANVSCALNLVGVSYSQPLVADNYRRQLGPATSGGTVNVIPLSGVQNWYAGLQKSRATNSYPTGPLEKMEGGGVRQGGYDSYIWTAAVDGSVPTDTREVVMKEVQLY